MDTKKYKFHIKFFLIKKILSLLFIYSLCIFFNVNNLYSQKGGDGIVDFSCPNDQEIITINIDGHTREICDYCGNGVQSDLEECDLGEENGPGVYSRGPCRADCSLPYCGDGIANEFDVNETCDQADFHPDFPNHHGKPCRSPRSRNNKCTFCGDGSLDDPSEECDEAQDNGKLGYYCDSNCRQIENLCDNSEPPSEHGETKIWRPWDNDVQRYKVQRICIKGNFKRNYTGHWWRGQAFDNEDVDHSELFIDGMLNYEEPNEESSKSIRTRKTDLEKDVLLDYEDDGKRYNENNILIIDNKETKNVDGSKSKNVVHTPGIVGFDQNYGDIAYFFSYYTDNLEKIDGLGDTEDNSLYNICWTCAYVRLEGCFAKGSRILMADGTYKKIEDLYAGEEVYNPVTKKASRIQSLLESTEELPLIELKYKNNILRVTQDHPMLTSFGIIQAKTLKVGDKVIGQNGIEELLEEVNILDIDPAQRVYNLVLESEDDSYELHSIIAEGFATGDLIAQQRLALEVKN